MFVVRRLALTPALVFSQDDIIDDVESFVAAAEILKERGAYKIYVMATHGILSAEAPRLIEESSIDEVGLRGKASGHSARVGLGRSFLWVVK